MISEFDRADGGRAAAVIQLERGNETDFFAFLAACGIGDPPLSLGDALYLALFPDKAEVNSFLLSLAAKIEAPGPGLAMELVETRMVAIGGNGEMTRCGDFLIVPPGRLRPGAGEIVLSSGIGFGSGTHPSTRLAMSLLARAMADLRPKTVLDAGCGSGILALAAARYGAASVLAVEADPRAAGEAGENVRLNRLAGIVQVRRCGVEEIDAAFDLVIANMTPAVLSTIASRLADFTSGDLVISGLQGRQVDDFADMFAVHGFIEKAREKEGGWGALILSRCLAF